MLSWLHITEAGEPNPVGPGRIVALANDRPKGSPGIIWPENGIPPGPNRNGRAW